MVDREQNELMHKQPLGDLNYELKGLICSVRELQDRITDYSEDKNAATEIAMSMMDRER